MKEKSTDCNMITFDMLVGITLRCSKKRVLCSYASRWKHHSLNFCMRSNGTEELSFMDQFMNIERKNVAFAQMLGKMGCFSLIMIQAFHYEDNKFSEEAIFIFDEFAS